jgi:DNA-binding protein HU-alpha
VKNGDAQQEKITLKATTTAAPKPAALIVPKATVVEEVKPVVAQAPIKKPELIDRVIAETGLKKKDVKPVVEAMLAGLGRTLADGEEITAPPMSKLMIKRVNDTPNA